MKSEKSTRLVKVWEWETTPGHASEVTTKDHMKGEWIPPKTEKKYVGVVGRLNRNTWFHGI